MYGENQNWIIWPTLFTKRRIKLVEL